MLFCQRSVYSAAVPPLSPELVDGRAVFGDVREVERLVPFRAPVVIVALYGGRRLLEADVVEASEGSTADVFDRVVWDQELLLPPHEDIVPTLQLFVIKVV